MVNLAKKLQNYGFKTVPLYQKSHFPFGNWKKNELEITENVTGLALVCGMKLNDGKYLTAVDFDIKNEKKLNKAVDSFLNSIQLTKFQRDELYIEKTKSNGVHIFFKTSKPVFKVTRKPVDGGDIEVFGEHLINIAPTVAFNQKTKKEGYYTAQQGSLFELPVIDIDIIENYFNVDKSVKKVRKIKRFKSNVAIDKTLKTDENLPFEDYSREQKNKLSAQLINNLGHEEFANSLGLEYRRTNKRLMIFDIRKSNQDGKNPSLNFNFDNKMFFYSYSEQALISIVDYLFDVGVDPVEYAESMGVEPLKILRKPKNHITRNRNKIEKILTQPDYAKDGFNNKYKIIKDLNNKTVAYIQTNESKNNKILRTVTLAKDTQLEIDNRYLSFFNEKMRKKDLQDIDFSFKKFIQKTNLMKSAGDLLTDSHFQKTNETYNLIVYMNFMKSFWFKGFKGVVKGSDTYIKRSENGFFISKGFNPNKHVELRTGYELIPVLDGAGEIKDFIIPRVKVQDKIYREYVLRSNFSSNYVTSLDTSKIFTPNLELYLSNPIKYAFYKNPKVTTELLQLFVKATCEITNVFEQTKIPLIMFKKRIVGNTEIESNFVKELYSLEDKEIDDDFTNVLNNVFSINPVVVDFENYIGFNQELADFVNQNRTTSVIAKTGSGKTTTFVDMALLDKINAKEKIVFLQPKKTKVEQLNFEIYERQQELGTNKKIAFITGDISNPWKVYRDNDIIISTYDSATKIIELIEKGTKDRNDFFFVIDEVHNLLSAKSYKSAVVDMILNLIEEYRSALITGTPYGLYQKERIPVIYFRNKNKQKSNTKHVFIRTNDCKESKLATTISYLLTKKKKKNNKIDIIRVSTKKELSVLHSACKEIGLKSDYIYSERKTSEVYRDIVTKSRLSNGLDVLITTSIIDDAININNDNVGNVIIASNSGTTSINDVLQFVARFRKGVDSIYHFLLKEDVDSIDDSSFKNFKRGKREDGTYCNTRQLEEAFMSKTMKEFLTKRQHSSIFSFNAKKFIEGQVLDSNVVVSKINDKYSSLSDKMNMSLGTGLGGDNEFKVTFSKSKNKLQGSIIDSSANFVRKITSAIYSNYRSFVNMLKLNSLHTPKFSVVDQEDITTIQGVDLYKQELRAVKFNIDIDKQKTLDFINSRGLGYSVQFASSMSNDQDIVKKFLKNNPSKDFELLVAKFDIRNALKDLGVEETVLQVTRYIESVLKKVGISHIYVFQKTVESRVKLDKPLDGDAKTSDKIIMNDTANTTLRKYNKSKLAKIVTEIPEDKILRVVKKDIDFIGYLKMSFVNKAILELAGDKLYDYNFTVNELVDKTNELFNKELSRDDDTVIVKVDGKYYRFGTEDSFYKKINKSIKIVNRNSIMRDYVSILFDVVRFRHSVKVDFGYKTARYFNLIKKTEGYNIILNGVYKQEVKQEREMLVDKVKSLVIARHREFQRAYDKDDIKAIKAKYKPLLSLAREKVSFVTNFLETGNEERYHVPHLAESDDYRGLREIKRKAFEDAKIIQKTLSEFMDDFNKKLKIADRFELPPEPVVAKPKVEQDNHTIDISDFDNQQYDEPEYDYEHDYDAPEYV